MKEIALRITGADDGEIEADTPLMEAGLTSNSVQVLVWGCVAHSLVYVRDTFHRAQAIIMRDVPWLLELI